MTREDDRAVGLTSVRRSRTTRPISSASANASVRAATRGAEIHFLSLDKYDEARRRAASEAMLPVFGGGNRDAK
jgi:hypothetical protein